MSDINPVFFVIYIVTGAILSFYFGYSIYHSIIFKMDTADIIFICLGSIYSILTVVFLLKICFDKFIVHKQKINPNTITIV